MRLPYAPNPPPTTTPEDAAIVSSVLARRAPRPLQPLDLAMMHSLPLAEGWNTFYLNIRTKTSLGDDAREVAICTVAALTRAYYEWPHHMPLAKKAGVSEEGIRGIRDLTLEGLDGRLKAVSRYAREMTERIEVGEGAMGEVRKYLNDREVVELTMCVAAYNCTSRFLVALDVGECNGRKAVKDWET